MIWIVGLGGILGAVCRYLLAIRLLSKSKGFPYGTWIANLSGSFLLGCMFSLHINHSLTEALWLFIGIGFLGSYTTMSTFGYEVIFMLEEKKINKAILYVATSLTLSLFLAWIGWEFIAYILNY